MDNFILYDHKEAQRQYEERIRRAQAWHAQQRQIRRQLAQATTGLGKWLLAWRERLQTRQTLTHA